MSPLQVGLIGCGSIAQLVHLKLLTRLPDVELVALAEPDAQRRKGASKRALGAVAFATYQELLALPEVEAVVICLPNALHAEAAVAALERGKHVYLEKPLAISLNEGRRVLAAWRRAGVIGMIGFNLRFHKLFQAVQQHIRSRRIGALISARSTRSTVAQTLAPWKLNRQSGGGVLLDLASHHIDLVHFLFGQAVREVFAELRSQRSEGDSAMLQLRLADGLPVQAFFSLNAVEEDRLEVYGQAGKLTIDRYLSLGVEITEAAHRFSRFSQFGRKLWSLAHHPSLVAKIFAPRREPSYRAALAQFVSAVRARQPTTPDFWDGYRSLAVIAAAEESARMGKVVTLPDLADEDFAG